MAGTQTITAELFGDVYQIRADWADAGSNIYRAGPDDDFELQWEATGFQVADFAHRPAAAMRHELEQSVRAGGDDPEDFAAEIASALE